MNILERYRHLSRRRPVLRLLALALAGCVLLAASYVSPVIFWDVLAPGGGRAGVGNVAVDDTLGQAVAGPSGGDTIRLDAGFWQPEDPTEPDNSLYLPAAFYNAGAR